MGSGHGERLSVLDETFFELESTREQMHTAGLFIFEPTADDHFDFGELIRFVRSRLHLVPRYRQKLKGLPRGFGGHIWVDDPQFDISYHVRHAALPSPGRIDQLTDYAARIVSRPLDRERPLWELYAIEGIEEGRVAFLGKTHHAMIDGVTGVDVATLLLDFEEDAGEIPPPRSWTPAPTPSDSELAYRAMRETLASPGTAIRRAQALVSAPRTALSRLSGVGQGLVSMARAGVSPAPTSPLNGRIGAFRRFAIQRLPLDDVRFVKDAFGTSVNDVVLTVIGDALGRFLRGRGDPTRGLDLKAMVPVSVRIDEEEQALFRNRISSILVPLPVDEMDPSERLTIVQEATKDVKEHEQAVGAEFLVGLSGYAPPTLHGMAARVAARTRLLYNLVVTNVPGPQVPLYSMGMRLLGAFPFLPLTQNHRLTIGVTSIDGWLNFGLSGDWDSLPDLEGITPHLVDALDELKDHADAMRSRGELVRKGLNPRRDRQPAPD